MGSPTPIASKDRDNRRILFFGDFTETQAKEVVGNLLDLEEKDPTKDIAIYIDSYGGLLDSAIAIHDVIKTIRCRVAGICVGKAMSCGAFLLMSCTKGLRFMTPNSRIMLHETSGGTFGGVSEMDIEIAEFRRMQSVMFELMLKNSGMNRRDLSSLCKKTSAYVDAKRAVELGIADEILNSNVLLSQKLSM